MKFKVLVLACALVFSGMSQAGLLKYDGSGVSSANDTPELLFDINDFGRITGGYNLQVGGDFYDVVFKQATVRQATDELDATTIEEATAFSNAIIDQLLVNTSFGAFDDNYLLVEGCNNFTSGRCGLGTAYFAGTIEDIDFGFSYDQANFMNARSTNFNADQYGNIEQASSVGYGLPYWYDRSLNENNSLWADWTLSSQRSGATTGENPTEVSEPATAAILALGGIALFARRRKLSVKN